MFFVRRFWVFAFATVLMSLPGDADAEPRSIKIRPDGSTIDMVQRTDRTADHPRKDVSTEKDQPRGKSRPKKDGGTSDGDGGSGDDPSGISALPPLDLSDMSLWNWQGKWHASEWDNAFSDMPWRYDHVVQNIDGDTFFNLDPDGAPELKGQHQPAQISGLWEADVTIPEAASGLAIAPLWLYNGTTKDEIDFEFVGTQGLQVNIHSYISGRHVQDPVMIPNTEHLAGQRVRFGIMADLEAGWIKLLVNDEVVHQYNRIDNPAAFPSSGLKPIISMWTAKSGLYWAEQWLGKWAGGSATMIVHGYQYTP